MVAVFSGPGPACQRASDDLVVNTVFSVVEKGRLRQYVYLIQTDFLKANCLQDADR